MKFSSILFSAACIWSNSPIVSANNEWQDGWYNMFDEVSVTNQMWVMASDGIHIMSADGSTTQLVQSNTDICRKGTGTDGTTSQDCNFVEAVSDGSKYVWVTNSSPEREYYVDVFSMHNGAHVASIPTCSVARHLDYAPHREELWVSCWMNPSQATSEDDGQLAVYSTNALGVKHDKVELFDLSVHAHGVVVVEPSIPNYVFGLSSSGPNVYRVSASTREVASTTEIAGSEGLDEYAFSKVNNHLYLRTYVCCSCEDSDNLSCDGGRGYGNVTVSYGPSASSEPQGGYCGLFCRATAADTQGLVEYDAKNDVIVGRHYPPSGTYGLKPYATPSGDLVFFGTGSSQTIVVMRPGASGAMSTKIGTITLPFDVDDDSHGTSDMTVATVGSREIAIFTSTVSNTIALVDLSAFDSASSSNSVSVTATDLLLHDGEEVSSAHDVRGINVRRVRWATDTNYVWVDSNANDQIHIIYLPSTGSLSQASVLRTIDINSLDFVFVRNYYEERIKGMVESLIEGSSSDDSSSNSNSNSNSGSSNSGSTTSTSELQALESAIDEMEGDSDATKRLSVASIVLSTLAMAAAFVAVIASSKRQEKLILSEAAAKDQEVTLQKEDMSIN